MGNQKNVSEIICIDTRNGIELIDMSKVVYMKADGNYTGFVTTDGKARTYLSSLAHFEEEITSLYDRNDMPSPFFRISRSYLVNTDYVQSVNLCTQMLGFFSDAVKPLFLSKRLLKTLHSVVSDKYRKSVGD